MLSDLLSELRVPLQELPKPHERPHDLDVHLDGAWTSEDARQHRDALFREGVGQVLATELAARLTAQQRATKASEDATIWETLANDEIAAHREAAQAQAQRNSALEAQNKKLLAELAALQAAAQAMPTQQLERAIEQASEASEAIELDEAATRKLIDRQLRNAGWEVDSERLTFENGVRPTRGKNLAIAEWPTEADGKEGWADYVLFAGFKFSPLLRRSGSTRT